MKLPPRAPNGPPDIMLANGEDMPNADGANPAANIDGHAANRGCITANGDGIADAAAGNIGNPNGIALAAAIGAA